MINKKAILVLGQMPPPYMGPSIATVVILNSKLKNEFNLIHLDTSDHRDLNTLGVIDFQNVYLALKHYIILLWLIITRWPKLVYMEVTQTTKGYLRDIFFILISKLFRRKVICHLRGGNFRNWYNSATVITRWLVRQVHSLVDGQIVLGENLRHLFDYIVPKEKIFVVPNGKDIKIDFNKKKQSNKIRILYLSNFIREKGILDVLKAIPDVYYYNPHVEFIFAGNWRDKVTEEEFKNFLIVNPNLPIYVEGQIYGQAKYDLLTTSDIFVFPTYYSAEGHPWVIVEAMAASLPIITTNQGAIIELVIEGVNGFIVQKKNPHQLAGRIKHLINNPELCIKMGKESRKLYLENFTEEKMVKKLSYVFKNVLSN